MTTLTKNLCSPLLAAFALLAAAVVSNASANPNGGPPLANSADVTIQDFFNVPDSDVSALVMREIFGPVAWERATSYAGTVTPEETGAMSQSRSALEGGILGALSSVLNLACMMMVVIIVGWGLISANLSGTIQGLSVGQNYDPVWVPFRSVLSFGLLLPVVGGYSLVQIIGMKAIMLSIGIANAGYAIVLGFLFSGTPTVPVSVPNVSEVASVVLAQELCAHFSVDHDGLQMVALNDLPLDRSKAFFAADAAAGNEPPLIKKAFVVTTTVAKALWRGEGRDTLSVKKYSYDLLRGNGPGYCGTMSLTQYGGSTAATGGGAISATLMEARISALEALRADMRSIVIGIDNLIATASDVNPSDVGSAGEVSPLLALKQNFIMAELRYRNALTQAAGSAAAAIQANMSTKSGFSGAINADASGANNLATGDAATALREGGWILLGSVYWNIATQNNRIQDLLKDLSVITQAPDMALMMERPSQNDQVISIANEYYNKLIKESRHDFHSTFDGTAIADFTRRYSDFESESPGGLSMILQKALVIMDGHSMGEMTVSMLTADGDIVGNLSTMGKVFWNIGVIGGGIALVSGSTSSKDAKESKALQWAIKKLPVGYLATGLAGVAGVLAAIAIPCLLAGFFLAFYLPMVPMILWIFNIIGWMLQSVKAIMALPVWAVAHAIPEGPGIAGMTARQGYVLLIGIVLRPLLLVVGIMTGAVMLQMVGWVIRYMAPSMVGGFNVTDPPMLFGFLAMLLIFTFIMVSAALRCFALSHELADEILEWIGGNARTLGDGNNLAEVQRGVGSGASESLRTAATAGAGAAAGVAASRATAQEPTTKSDQDDKNKQSSTGNV